MDSGEEERLISCFFVFLTANADQPEERCTAPSDKAGTHLPTASFLICMANHQ